VARRWRKLFPNWARGPSGCRCGSSLDAPTGRAARRAKLAGLLAESERK
jgi:hypothetical protein